MYTIFPNFSRSDELFAADSQTRRQVIETDHPVDLIGRPIILTDRPVDLIGRPIILTERPVDLIGRPVILTDRPVDLTERPVFLTGRPMPGSYIRYSYPYLYQALQLPSVDTIHGPTGVSGLHFLPKSGQSGGSIIPRSTSPQRQPLGGEPGWILRSISRRISMCL